MDLQDVKMDIGSHRPLREVVYEELKRNIMTGRMFLELVLWRLISQSDGC